MGKERRRLNRFEVQDKVFVSVGLNLPRVGRIKDISKGGLAFEYLTDYMAYNIDEDSDDKSLQATIFLVGNQFCLNDIPCMIVYDIPGRVFLNSLIVKKRCGIQFGSLTQTQWKKMIFFLSRYATVPVP